MGLRCSCLQGCRCGGWAFGFHHVAFQLDGITLAVTPEKPGLSIVVDEHGGVDTYPRMGGSCTIGIGQQRTTDGIVEGAFRSVGHGHTNARTVGADVEIVFSVALDALPGIGGSATVPFEVAYAERGGVFRPMGEVGGGEDFPVLQLVVGLSAGLVVAGVKPKGVAFDHRGGVAGEEVRDERISVGLEMAKVIGFCGLPEEGEGKGQRKQGAKQTGLKGQKTFCSVLFHGGGIGIGDLGWGIFISLKKHLCPTTLQRYALTGRTMVVYSARKG